MQNYKVVITARSFGEGDDEPFQILMRAGYEVNKLKVEQPLKGEELIPLVEDADALIIGNDDLNERVILAAKKLKVISRYGVGYDNIDLDAAKNSGIVVTNTPNTNDNSVADLSIALMLSLARNIPQVTNIVKNNQWKRVLGTEIWGKTLGIVGLGRIGKGVAHRAKGFNMKVLCYDKFPNLEYEKEHEIRYCTFEEILRESDFISVHLPLLSDTKNLIDKKALELMKPEAFIINTARGGVIDETALYEALINKVIAGAALDVTEIEPPTNSPLLDLNNIIITSHIGGYTADAVRNMGITAAKNVVLVLNGEEGAHIVYERSEG